MSTDQILVTLAGLVAIAGVAWFFWGPRRARVHAVETPSGRQEATIVVKGAYSPDVIVVEHGTPVRLTFLRQETAACYSLTAAASPSCCARRSRCSTTSG